MTSPATRGRNRPRWGLPHGAAQMAEEDHPDRHTSHDAHGAHHWMMLICCIPMVAIVIALIASGTAGYGALLWAVICVTMMAVMMLMMPGGHDHK